MEIPTNEIIAEGSEGLMQVLTDLSEKSKNNPSFAKQDHFILYQLGKQRSLILVDSSKEPFHLWHYDLLGKSATLPVKQAIERQGLGEHFEDISGKEVKEKNKIFIKLGGRVDVDLEQHTLSTVREKLLSAKKAFQLTESLAAAVSSIPEPKKSSTLDFLGIFGILSLRGRSDKKQAPLKNPAKMVKK